MCSLKYLTVLNNFPFLRPGDTVYLTLLLYVTLTPFPSLLKQVLRLNILARAHLRVKLKIGYFIFC